jgi:hypothetical protein
VKLGQKLGFTVPVRALFEHATPSALATWLEAQTNDELADILAELESLSDEEARALLDKQEIS